MDNPVYFIDPDGRWPTGPIPLVKFLVKLLTGKSISSSRDSSSGGGGGGSEQGGVMLANEKGGSSGSKDLIRNGGRAGSEVPWVNAQGLVDAASYASSFRDGIKYKPNLRTALLVTKETVKGMKIGYRLGGLIENDSSTDDSNESADSSTLEETAATSDDTNSTSNTASVDVKDTFIYTDMVGNGFYFNRTGSKNIKVEVPNNESSIDSVRKVYEEKAEEKREEVNLQWE